MRVAAIDIGTVTCRLLVADVEGGEVTPIERLAEIVNLGEGVDSTGVLREDARERTIAQVKRFKRIAWQPSDGGPAAEVLVAVATSASRDAANASEFVSRLASEGIRLSVIPGQKEAELSFSGAADGYAGRPVAVVDIGGGSTEVIAGVSRPASQGGVEIFDRHSFDVGCRRMTERFLESDPPSQGELDAARQWAAREMAGFIGGLPETERLIAVAGTATTAVSIRDAMEVYDPDRVHGSIVTRKQLQEVYDRIRVMPLGARQKVTGLQPQRASVIVAGFLILDVVLEAFGAESFTVSEHDILQGIVLDAVSKACRNHADA